MGCLSGDEVSLTPGDDSLVGEGDSGGGVLGWRGGVLSALSSAGRDSGSLSGDSVGSNGSYLSGSGGVMGPLLGVG